MKKLILISVMMVYSITCFSQKGKWAKTQEINTCESYQEFLEKYPNSEFYEEAKQRLIELEFNKAIQKNTVDGYKLFLKKYGGCMFTDQATNNILKLEFEKYEKMNTEIGYREFMEKFPDSGGYFEKAQNFVINSQLNLTKRYNTTKDYKLFIRKYPESKQAIEAGNLLIQLEEFENVKEKNTIEAYESFIKEFPNTLYAGEAQKNIEMLKEWERVETNLSLESYFHFYEKYPGAYMLLTKNMLDKFVKDSRNYLSEKNNSITVDIAKGVSPGSSISVPFLSNCNYEVLKDGFKLNTQTPLSKIYSDERSYIIHFYSTTGMPMVFKWTVNKEGNLYTFNYMSGKGYVLYQEGGDVKIWNLN